MPNTAAKVLTKVFGMRFEISRRTFSNIIVRNAYKCRSVQACQSQWVPVPGKSIKRPDARHLSTSALRRGSEAVQPSSTRRRRVVVFDFDETLAKGIYPKEEEFAKKNHPECPLTQCDRYKFICLPHLGILFQYLLEQSVRIAFFSAAEWECNAVRIPRLLTTVFGGSQKYEELKSEGQFEIFSEEHLRKIDRSLGERGKYKKDMRVVIRDGESLSDILLVEDNYWYVAHDQHPFLQTIDLMRWYLREEPDNYHPLHESYSFPKNGTYYMLGVFMTYFEEEKYEKLPFREGIKQILPEEEGTYYFLRPNPVNPFVRNMITKGLSEVQKQVPSAIIYGSRHFD